MLFLRILKTLCRKLKLAEDFDYKQLARLTPGYVGADLMALVREAAMSAVNRVLLELRAMAPSIEGSTEQSVEPDMDQSTEQSGGHTEEGTSVEKDQEQQQTAEPSPAPEEQTEQNEPQVKQPMQPLNGQRSHKGLNGEPSSTHQQLHFSSLSSDPAGGAVAPAAAAQEHRGPVRRQAGEAVHTHVGLPGVPGEHPALGQEGGLRHGARRQLGGRGSAAGHQGGADHGYTGKRGGLLHLWDY